MRVRSKACLCWCVCCVCCVCVCVERCVCVCVQRRVCVGVCVCCVCVVCVMCVVCAVCVQRYVRPMPLSTSWPLPFAVCPLVDAAVDLAVAFASPLPLPLLSLLIAVAPESWWPSPIHLGLKAVCDSQRAAQCPFSRKKKLYDHAPRTQSNTTLFQEHVD